METLPDIPRIYTALSEWLTCMLCVTAFRKRYDAKIMTLLSAVMLAVMASFLIVTDDCEDIAWVICMLIAVALMYCFIVTGIKVNWRDGAYLCCQCFVLAEFAASLEWQIDCYIFSRGYAEGMWFHLLLLLVVYGGVFACTGWLYFNRKKMQNDLNITGKELIACLIIAIAVFVMSNLGFVSANTIFSGRYAEDIYNVRTLVDLGGVAIMYAFHIERLDRRTRSELEIVQNILHNQYAQYKQSRESMEVINYKYHDLKHHIYALRAEENEEKRNAYLDRMEKELQDYEALSQTGNTVLDVLLTSKTLYCQKHHIALTAVIDGKHFDFMDAMDICSLFGNALDNAIECELKIKEYEKRLIHVTAYSQKQFLIVQFENYMEEMNVPGEGFPETTKSDVQFHGYGLKSIQYTVKKYGGQVNISVRDHWFNLNVLIPIRE